MSSIKKKTFFFATEEGAKEYEEDNRLYFGRHLKRVGNEVTVYPYPAPKPKKKKEETHRHEVKKRERDYGKARE